MWPFGKRRSATDVAAASTATPVVARQPDDGGWRVVAPLPPTVTPIAETIGVDRFESGLASRSDARFVSELDHLVAPDGPGGLVRGMVEPSAAPSIAASTWALPSSRPNRPTPTVARRAVADAPPAASLTVASSVPAPRLHFDAVGQPSPPPVVAREVALEESSSVSAAADVAPADHTVTDTHEPETVPTIAAEPLTASTVPPLTVPSPIEQPSRSTATPTGASSNSVQPTAQRAAQAAAPGQVAPSRHAGLGAPLARHPLHAIQRVPAAELATPTRTSRPPSQHAASDTTSERVDRAESPSEAEPTVAVGEMISTSPTGTGPILGPGPVSLPTQRSYITPVDVPTSAATSAAVARAPHGSSAGAPSIGRRYDGGLSSSIPAALRTVAAATTTVDGDSGAPAPVAARTTGAATRFAEAIAQTEATEYTRVPGTVTDSRRSVPLLARQVVQNNAYWPTRTPAERPGGAAAVAPIDTEFAPVQGTAAPTVTTPRPAPHLAIVPVAVTTREPMLTADPVAPSVALPTQRAVIQRAADDAPPPPVEAPPPVAVAAAPTAAPTTSAAPAAAAAPTDADLETLAGRLYPRLRDRLRSEIRLDRERVGRVTDLGLRI